MKYYLEKKSGPLSFDKHMKKIMIIIFGQEMIKLLQLSTINYIIMTMFEQMSTISLLGFINFIARF